MKLSILIKAYNEEKHIGSSIESALAAARNTTSEVIIADSCSQDATIAIASQYPVKIVQFTNASERGCGAGAQLAYQHAQGEFVYLLDGDMVLRPGFVDEAIAYLEAHPDVSGVGGIVNDIYRDNLEFRNRAARAGHATRVGGVPKLDCGGLYRRSAIEGVRFFADRNLHSYEELDLGSRLLARGGQLIRLPTVSVDHYTHDVGSYQLLAKRMTSNYARGAGEAFRAAIGRPHFWHLLPQLRIVKIIGFMAAWLFLLLGGLFLPWPYCSVSFPIFVLPFAMMSIRRRSIAAGIFSVASWTLYAVGFIRGLFTVRLDPALPISSIIVNRPSHT